MYSRILALALLAGCSDLNITNTGTLSTPSDGTGATGDDDDSSQAPAEAPLAGDLSISKISIYQTVEIVLYENGSKPTRPQASVVTQRDGVLRVFVQPDNQFQPRKVKGILTLSDNSGDTVLESKLDVSRASTDADPSTTIDFDLAGDLLKPTTSMVLEIHEVGPNGPGGGVAKDVVWRSNPNGGIDLEQSDTLNVKVVPIRYNTDGSGRLPDTSSAAIKAIADEVQAMYPIPNVVVTVDQPFDWNQTISANGNGWDSILNAIVNYRGSKNETPNTYYYAAFEPKSSFYTFCGYGCVAGLSYVGYVSQPATRASVGIGYTGWTADTLVHEMGHAHGRQHSPCGGAAQPDPQYPYPGAQDGVWGWDSRTGRFNDPVKYKDMMGYCTPMWISDYVYDALLTRIQTIARQNRDSLVVRPTLSLGVDGEISTGPTLAFDDTSDAPRIDLDLFDQDGLAAGTLTAAFLPYDHLPGGMVILDQDLPEGWTAKPVSSL